MKTTIEFITTETDSLGRCQFFLNWTKGAKKKSQAFFANPESYGHSKPLQSIPKPKAKRAAK